jgi:NADH-quinone oxidoreductase subunit L
VHSNNMSDMGGLRKYMPHTFKTFIIGSLALGGIFPLAGFFSKDEIIGEALRSASAGTAATAWIVFISGVVTAFLTALYMTRVCIKTFWGDYRGHGHPHESPGSMVTPLWVLAVLTATVGLLGLPEIGPFKEWINVPGEATSGFSTFYNIILPVASVALAGVAIWLGYMLFYKKKWQVDILGGPFAWAYRLLVNKYYMDDLYTRGVVKPIQYTLAKAAYWSNQNILDGAVNGVAAGTIGTANFTYDELDQKVVDYAVNGAAGLTGASGGLLRYIQGGNVQRYAAVLFAAIAIFIGLFALTSIVHI